MNGNTKAPSDKENIVRDILENRLIYLTNIIGSEKNVLFFIRNLKTMIL